MELNESGSEEIASFSHRVTCLCWAAGVLAVAAGTSCFSIIKDRKLKELSCLHAGLVDTLELVTSFGLDGSLLL